MSDKLIPIGRLVNVHATRGELKLLPYNPDSTTLAVGSEILLRRDVAVQAYRVTAIRRHKKFQLLTLAGCASMNAAEALVGSEVCVPETALPPAGSNEIYHYRLVGMQVVTQAGDEVGVVSEVMPLPGADACVVRSGDGREFLIPMVSEVVKSIDDDGRRLVIDPIPGLLDL